jgi:tRNA nucleotidyltransferase (CCA-adding enzyme)
MKIYLVGGAVRDRLLGRPVTERDWVVVGGSPEDLLAQGYKPVGADFPVFLHPTTHEEYALARTERKRGHGYRGFECYAAPDVSLEDDLKRRDLTINAIAEDEHGRLIDPFQGQRDLEQRLLRHVSPAFAEDPVRILRVARFAARYAPLGFTVASETHHLMRQMVDNGEVDHLVPERVWAEMYKVLGEDQPWHFFETLKQCGALKRLLPEIDCLFGVPQPPQHHPEIDTGIHTLLALQQAAQLTKDVATRFAVLVHDLGKGTTPPATWPHHRDHEIRGATLIKQLCQRLRIPNECRDLAIHVAQYHTHCHRALDLRASTLVDLLSKLDAFRKPARFEAFLVACEADARGRTGLESRPYPQADTLRGTYAAAVNIDTRALIPGEHPGPAIAERIRQARIRAVKNFLREDESAQGDSIT